MKDHPHPQKDTKLTTVGLARHLRSAHRRGTIGAVYSQPLTALTDIGRAALLEYHRREHGATA